MLAFDANTRLISIAIAISVHGTDKLSLHKDYNFYNFFYLCCVVECKLKYYLLYFFLNIFSFRITHIDSWLDFLNFIFSYVSNLFLLQYQSNLLNTIIINYCDVCKIARCNNILQSIVSSLL